jgi:transposase
VDYLLYARRAIFDYLTDRPTAYLDEIAWFLFDEHEVFVTARTVWNSLSRGGWTRKIGRHIAIERNQELRAYWKARAAHIGLDRLIFVDESAAAEKTGWRKYGWSPLGLPVNNVKSTKRSKRWSILPALSVNGYLNHVLVKQGSITADDFISWIWQYVLPQTFPGQVIVMDNASIHHDDRLQEIVTPYGVSIEYLPPYSPDFNPIEQSFNELKSFIKRQQAVIATYDNFGEFLLWALSEFQAPHAKEQFKKCGYDMEGF